jgi:hypothetical protein
VIDLVNSVPGRLQPILHALLPVLTYLEDDKPANAAERRKRPKDAFNISNV